MADAEPHSLASTFPNPPPFWHDFTPEKIRRAEALRKTSTTAIAATTCSSRSDLPPDLVHLQPPREPKDGRWRVFGDQYMLDDKLPTLEEQGIANLQATGGPSSSRESKHYDRALELKCMAKSLLLNFLELTGLLSRSPAHAEAKMQDLRTLFINMHHVLNEYRPHQARESAMEMMQDHLDRTRAETLAIRTQVDKTRSVLEGLGSLAIGEVASLSVEERGAAADGHGLDALAEEEEEEERDRGVWAVVDEVLG
ncbi:hypothetical protein L249_3078 [Ophiocordyceps polyrhachis-furcata BCC 54312]|uniref:Mediator of RNA polymerase II transcription subunit 7 n=1 Tax=Ophiocordyceps polyrhachis-furcata BCC 54312 TaxID=1330021 RepID=A0A367LRA4_9HYPO|nr:hypothetical protein L249_3078 [Ophiocordyceps polyrhachis-furcata BCC 54312]